MKSNSEFQKLYQSSLPEVILEKNIQVFWSAALWALYEVNWTNCSIYKLKQVYSWIEQVYSWIEQTVQFKNKLWEENFPDKLQLQTSTLLEFIQICDNLYNVT